MVSLAIILKVLYSSNACIVSHVNVLCMCEVPYSDLLSAVPRLAKLLPKSIAERCPSISQTGFGKYVISYLFHNVSLSSASDRKQQLNQQKHAKKQQFSSTRRGEASKLNMSLSSLLAPFTLPLASLFAIPFLSSTTTSLNLLFFSLTWTTLALSYSPLQLEFFAPLLLRTALYLLPSALFLLLDLAIPSLMVEFKAQRTWGLPARQRGGTRKVGHVVAWSVVNVLLAVALQAGMEWLVTDVFSMRSLLVIKGNRWALNHLPNPWSLIKHAAIGLVSRNVSTSEEIRKVAFPLLFQGSIPTANTHRGLLPRSMLIDGAKTNS